MYTGVVDKRRHHGILPGGETKKEKRENTVHPNLHIGPTIIFMIPTVSFLRLLILVQAEIARFEAQMQVLIGRQHFPLRIRIRIPRPGI